MSLLAWRGRKDVHSGTLCRDTTRSEGGRAEPAGGGPTLWRSPQHDHENASVFGSAGLSAARAAGLEEAGAVYGLGRQDPGGRPERSQKAAAYGAADFRTVAGQRGVFGRLYDRSRVCGASAVAVALSHRRGQAQADFGEADAYIAGKKVRFHYFCMAQGPTRSSLHTFKLLLGHAINQERNRKRGRTT